MKYTFQKKKRNDIDFLSIYTGNELFDQFFNDFLLTDVSSFHEYLLAMFNDVKKRNKGIRIFLWKCFRGRDKKRFF